MVTIETSPRSKCHVFECEIIQFKSIELIHFYILNLIRDIIFENDLAKISIMLHRILDFIRRGQFTPPRT